MEGGHPQAPAPEVEEWAEVGLELLEACPWHPPGFRSASQILLW